MPSSFGTTVHVSIFGQSHSEAVGCIVEGLPAGFPLDLDQLQSFMDRRAPGRNAWSTPRKEADAVEILSGLNDQGRTCGAPLAAVIHNTNTRPADYERLRRVPRPGHADFTAQAKWGGEQDVSGGGHFSARLTAPLCIAGGIALQMLAARGIRVAAHVAKVDSVWDEPFDAIDLSESAALHLKDQIERAEELAGQRAFPALDGQARERMARRIEDVRRAGDSVGGIVECVATGLQPGVGGPRYEGLQSLIARIVFGLPAVKGLEFGEGFSVSGMRGSQNNDAYGFVGNKPAPLTNHAGGSLGGISTGAPVLFRMAVKPTPSISTPQQSIDFCEGCETTLEVRGRHDPCVAPRAVPIAQAAMAVALLDALLSYPPQQQGVSW